MNYSLRLKEELIVGAPRRACCKKAYLRGLFLNAAQTKGGAVVLSLATLAARQECARVYRELYRGEALIDASTMLFSSERLYSDLTTTAPIFCCERCAVHFLRGAFVSAGSVTDPEKGYHLEFKVYEEEGRAFLVSLLEQHGWQAKCRIHRTGFGIYFKNSAVIEEILSALGANNALFTLMNAKITRGIRNEENRATNCVAKNIGKSVEASGRALDAITAIRQAARFDALPQELRETAALREENADASLSYLAKLHNPPLTKSGLNHRLQKIIAFSDTLHNKET
ncbi:MAG: DNA-binding protein WhiA [Clostridia bacterium]|nr:DNA-binding protein WhiA [Clostridia bacterium]